MKKTNNTQGFLGQSKAQKTIDLSHIMFGLGAVVSTGFLIAYSVKHSDASIWMHLSLACGVALTLGSGIYGLLKTTHFQRDMLAFFKDIHNNHQLPKSFYGQGCDDALKHAEAYLDDQARINFATECVTSSVMIADNSFNIVYCNPSMINTFLSVEKDIRKVFPHFDTKKIVGQNMDIFHKNPSHQRRMVEGLKNTIKTEINVGDCLFALIASPIMDQKNQRQGTVVEWRDVTSERANEKEIQGIVDQASHGNFSVRLDHANKEGFMKNLAIGMNQLCDLVETSLKDMKAFLDQLVQGNLTARMNDNYNGLLKDISEAANASMSNLDEMIQSVLANTAQIYDASKEMSAGAQDLSSRTEAQASSLEETAASIEEITAAVKSNSDNAQHATHLSNTASQNATHGSHVIQQAVEAMERIQTSAKKISEITNLIDEIAFQTNLLALNASVEAARAGDLGKGFAVVAQEVRSLAEHSAQASKQIKGLVDESSISVNDGSTLVQEAKQSLESIVDAVKNVSDMIQSISTASSEQSVGLDQINQVVTQLDSMTQKNAALVTESVATTASLDDQVQDLTHKMAFFKVNSHGGSSFGGGSSYTSPSSRSYH